MRARLLELSDQVRETRAHMVDALLATLSARERDTGGHSERVVRVTRAIALKLGLEGQELAEICQGALLHDLGKIGVPDSVLLKRGPLDPEEWEHMKRHPEIGYAILKPIPFLAAAAEIVLAHQERWDGRGYPRGLRGPEIPLGARIFAIADAVDAIGSDRPYRRGTSVNLVRAEIARCAGSQFDPQCVEAFLSLSDDELLELRS